MHRTPGRAAVLSRESLARSSSSINIRRLRRIMKTRRLVTLCALLATLMVSSMSSIAEEGGGGVITALSSTMISGYVDSSVIWQIQPRHDTPAHEYRGWWGKFFRLLGFHGLRLRD